MIKSELIALEILRNLEGFSSAEKIGYLHNFDRPWPDFVAYKDNVRFVVEAKTWNGTYYKISAMHQGAVGLDFLIVINLRDRVYSLVPITAKHTDKHGRVAVKPFKLKNWKPIPNQLVDSIECLSAAGRYLYDTPLCLF